MSKNKAKQLLEAYVEQEIPDLLLCQDPRHAGVFAARGTVHGILFDFLVDLNAPCGEDVEEVKFRTWPPLSKVR